LGFGVCPRLPGVSANQADELWIHFGVNLQKTIDSPTARSLLVECQDYRLRITMVLVNLEIVWALRLHIPRSERHVREILQIEGRDGLGAGGYCGGENVPVLRVDG
jgi:hypothetical protein